MGKRKKATRKPTGPKKREGLASSFACLFCNHENSVSCKIDRKAGIGGLDCKVCGQSFQTDINSLSAPIDVYSDWVDACDQVAKERERGGSPRRREREVDRSSPVGGGGGYDPRGADEDEDEDY
ncbi:Elf1-domain-containing protein [Ascobolus immersus RN42]|uniref:Transcription elongation factor 1 homolog n=1 Tax=Ascobolus immersus RN42 TaxID=1160509 RepID=A0A3N4I1M7_ASCIM|nr:Elf1-domain-containing protein [Ascobolus immersus RN42]